MAIITNTPWDAEVSNVPAGSELADLVELYLHQLQDSAESLEKARDSLDLEALRRLGHQLSRATFYGFPQIASRARELEDMARIGHDMEAIATQSVALASICRRARAGTD